MKGAGTMKQYFRGWTRLPLEERFRVAEKAIAIPVDWGHWGANHMTVEWFPKSQIIIGEPNQYGNAEILIPMWLLRQKRIQGEQLSGIEGFCDGSERIVVR